MAARNTEPLTNFQVETHDAIRESGHTKEDVMFIGSMDGKYRMTMDKFDEEGCFLYDSGFGGQNIAEDLIIYFHDKQYIRRREYDGSEWWEYNRPLNYTQQDEFKTFSNFTGGLWQKLEKMQEKDNK